MSRGHLVAFDLETTGHHAEYLRHLVRAWRRRPRTGALTLAVSAEMREAHPELMAEAAAAGVGVHIVEPRGALGLRELPLALTQRVIGLLGDPRLGPVARLVPGATRLAAQALDEWLALVSAARATRATHIVAMYIDRLLQVPLALGLRAPCPVSGIYFRPTFHYAELTGRPESRSDAWRAFRQRAIVRSALRNPGLHTLFSLDPFAADHLARLGGVGLKAKALPDPVEVESVDPARVDTLRARLGVARRQKVVLLFGMITSRKGADRVLRAVRALDPADAERLTVAIVGRADGAYRASLDADIAATREVTPATILREDRFVPDADNAVWFELADLVLIPYDRHVGMSGILVRAAAARRPVLADAFGLVGALVAKRRLGRAIETADATVFSAALTAWLRDPGIFEVHPTDQARFAVDNRAEAFAERLIQLGA